MQKQFQTFRSLIRKRLWIKAKDNLAITDKFPEDIAAIVRQVQPYTMTSPERVSALIEAVRYTIRRDIQGAFAECGVWRGGSVMAMILALQEMGAVTRDIYLYDTFEGMTEPTEHDISHHGPSALDNWQQAKLAGKRLWNEAFGPQVFNLDLVKANLAQTGYPMERLHFVQGPVEETIPKRAPNTLALLRLDTDWYESTLHELRHLYPKLQKGGVLIIDDYGHWQGCRRAVDEYFAQQDIEPVLLNRIDYTGRLAVKI